MGRRRERRQARRPAPLRRGPVRHAAGISPRAARQRRAARDAHRREHVERSGAPRRRDGPRSRPPAQRRAARMNWIEVGERLVRPTTTSRDRDNAWDPGLFREVASTGIFKLPDTRARALALEGLALGSLDLGFAVTCTAHLVCVEAIEKFASPSLRARLLPDLVDGKLLGACANAEPGAGTDLMGLKARVVGSRLFAR